MAPTHLPVLANEVIKLLAPQANEHVVDATFGAGGHARAFLEATAPGGQLVAIDQDPVATDRARAMGDRVHPVCTNFRQLTAAVHDALPDTPISCIFFDLGYSSLQLADESLGLSFQTDGPLDMRLSRSGPMTAATIVNSWSKNELAELFATYGEVRAAGRIAEAVIAARPLGTTRELARVVADASPVSAKRIHPATTVFQAIRMQVNDELGALREGLKQARELLTAGGRIGVLSFHSIEDREVKTQFREAAKNGWELVTKKPIGPTAQECATNPRARSAKLRVIRRAA